MFSIETSFGVTSIAIMREDKVFSYCDFEKNMQVERIAYISNILLLEANITWFDIKYIICGVGPGSFSSSRIGVSFVNGVLIAHQHISSIGINSFQSGFLSLVWGGLIKYGRNYYIGIESRKGKIFSLSKPIFCESNKDEELYRIIVELSKVIDSDINDDNVYASNINNEIFSSSERYDIKVVDSDKFHEISSEEYESISISQHFRDCMPSAIYLLNIGRMMVNFSFPFYKNFLYSVYGAKPSIGKIN